MSQPPKKRLNHVLPRFLLNRFTDASKPESQHIWQFRRSMEPFKTNTRNTAAASNFYGNPENGIEEALAAIESRHASALNDLLETGDLTSHHEALREFVWLISIRTANFRCNLGEISDALMGHIAQMISEPGAEYQLKQMVVNRFDSELGTILQRLPLRQRKPVELALKTRPALRTKLREVLPFLLDVFNVQEQFSSSLEVIRAMIQEDDPIEQGQIQALDKLLGANLVPDTFNPQFWKLVRSHQDAVILGDGGIVARGVDGEFGHPFRFESRNKDLYLPIANDAFLFAPYEEDANPVTVPELNRASASLAFDVFYASQNTQIERDLQTLIRTGTAALNHAEIREIAIQSWQSV